jgi:hypothetical protein
MAVLPAGMAGGSAHQIAISLKPNAAQMRSTGGCNRGSKRHGKEWSMIEPVLYGECVAPGAAAMVRIRGLVGLGCDLEADGGLPDGEVALWIGAIGPVAAIAECTDGRKDGRKRALRFKEPLDSRILAHFRSA